ncbi:UbiE/COQ5 methyltransferase [Polystyrenella longa]|uniref:Demethylmenaquinone methyltransferase n=1 Tax=Polystyrenella longa TaxID=2528007 RepID=A0A518CK17_9PLAN|nr:bifunctional demethylmenaquinone methyltransferase/2-methoxy-6-polyprenyl-1,4-benzoquinol methylase UbiE [Polystyrenella longa]QDU79557.1 UbiE/COQ5 methyltransferase [Polystyrenella longa]
MNVDKSGSRVRQMFGEISERYDFMNHLLSGGTDYYWRWRAVRTIRPHGDAPILDVCTGTGDLAFAFSKKATSETPIVGSDFTHQMLTIALEKQIDKPSRTNGQTVQFLEADTQQLPFEQNLFQIVSVAFGLRNVADTMSGLREMTRVCLPGGKVVILEFAMPSNGLLRGMYGWYFRNILPRIGQLLARNQQSAYNYLPESVSEFPYGEDLMKLMREAGLTEVEWRPLTFGVAGLYWGTKPKPDSE